MKRRTLLQAAASLAALPLTARAQTPKAWERVVARVGQNHGHVLAVSAADVRAGAEKTYDLTGSAGHPHAVTLTADDFKRLDAGETLRKPSTRDGHLHRLLVRCAPAIDPPEAVSVCAVEIGGKDDHEMIVTAADLSARKDRSYDIQGVSVHTHTVKLAAADFDRLARGEQVHVSTSPAQPGEDHTHVVFVRYPAR